MSFKEKMKRKFVLSDKGYRGLMLAALSQMLKSAAQMFAMMVLFILVADLVGDNTYDYNLEVWQYLVLIFLALVLLYITTIFNYDRCYYDVYNTSHEVRTSLADKIRKLPLSFFSRKDPAALSQSMLADVTVQESALSHWAPQLIGSFIFASIVAIMLIVWSPIMGIAAAWSIPVSVLLAYSTGKWQRKINRRRYLAQLDVTNGIQEGLEGLRDLEANGATDSYLNSLKKKLDDIENYQITGEFMLGSMITSITSVLRLGIVTTAIVGSYLLIDGEISLIVFIFFLITVARLYEPLESSIQFTAALNNAEDNFQHMREIEDQPTMEGSDKFEPENYDIVFEDVRFSYIDGQTILNGLSFAAKQGEVTAIIGPSGEGKTTAARLASRFWEVDSGKITVGGIDISTIDPEVLLSKYSMVFQDVVLFNTTILENIRMGRKDATDEEVLAAGKAAWCDEFVNKLPDGYQTLIGENGSKISGGERQRISIARALLKDAPIVLLDEATASLDTECESYVQAAISELVADKTVIIVAHRMRTVEGADKIVVFKNGVVAEQGKPLELIEQDGEFAKMDRIQKESFDWAL